MRVTRVLTIAAFGMVTAWSSGRAQQPDDQFRWYVGGQGGVFAFETPSQTRAVVPAFGGHLLVVAKRTGLLVSVDEALGDGEATGYADNTASTGVRAIVFDRVRKYAATLTGYPVRGRTQPYLGLGFGLLQVVNPQPDTTEFFTSPLQAARVKDEADQRSTDGFMSFVAGIQFRLGRVIGFGQYQITTSPSRGSLLRGPSHGIAGGLRFSLGGAKEGIKGGGY
jgi:hypothetical protein